MPQSKIKLDWEEVDSSNLDKITFHQPTETMAVKFKGGALYSYMKVSRDVYDGMLRAASAGGYLNDVIKKGRYAYTRWNDETELIEHLSL
ncbi:MAG: hypothetical protein B7Z80_02720 [Rhodospirillales bacterium 20-64-7]|nr:MAG: hypothetical protein B7Z80_02720 [Rhodospirillales bacterium 20-64-7]